VRLVALTLSILVAPFVAVGQPAGKVAKIGFLMSGSATAMTRNFEAFTQVLRELGYIEGQHIALEQRYDEGRPERLPVLAAELVSLKLEVCVVNTNRVAEAVQQTTTPIPIVMTTAEEPVHFGLTFRTLFRTSEAILEEPRVEGEAGAIYRLFHAP
jgi:putative ABC transport system substrate-binding protein